MIGSKAGAAGAKRSCRQSTKRKRDTKRDPGGVAGDSESDDGGSEVSDERDGVAGVKFIGVRDTSIVVEIKKYANKHNLYLTVSGGRLKAAIVHDVFRLCVDLDYPEEYLNIRDVGLCIQREAGIEPRPIGKRFLVEFMKQHLIKFFDDSPDAQFPLELEDLTKAQFRVLKEKIIKLAHQCFQDLKETIYHSQGYQRVDVDIIPPFLPEDNVPQEDDPIQALKDHFAKVVAAEFAPSNGKSMDAKSEAARSEFITHIKVELQKLEPARNLEDGELFFNPFVPQV